MYGDKTDRLDCRAARVLGCEVITHHAPELPLAHLELASFSPACGVAWARCLSHCPAMAGTEWGMFPFCW